VGVLTPLKKLDINKMPKELTTQRCALMPRPKREEMPELYLSPLEGDLLTLMVGRKFYSVEIERALKEVCGRNRSFGSIYPTLRGLEKRGLIDGEWGDDDPGDYRGPRRRYYTTNGLGEKALKEEATRRHKLTKWPLIPEVT
jgi:PadR family transcriptional regulator, regulatory protein PadR